MALFAQVRRPPDDIVPPFFHIGNPTVRYFYEVPDGDGIGGTNTTNAEIAFYTAFRIRTIVHADDVTASCRFDN
jgi:hypothetical protein